MHKTPDESKKGVEFCTTKVVSGNLKTCDLDCPYRVEGVWCRNALAHDTLEYIQNLEAKVPKWISVEERLPEGFATVLIMRDDIKQACVGWLIDGHWSVPKGVRVTHWMPLPSTEGLNDN